MKVLVSNIMMLNERSRFEKLLTEKGITPVFPDVDQFLREGELLNIVGDFDGWLAGDDQITKEVLVKSLPKLKVISKWGTGTDSIDKVAASELGVPIYNTPGAFRDAVAEVAIGYMLDLARSISATDRAVRAGLWPKTCSAGLVGKTLGIIGFGAIGKGIAERAQAFKMDVKVSDPCFKFDDEFPSMENVSFNEIIGSVDYLCLACNLSESNISMINKDVISLMRKGCVLINVARGGLVDEASLIDGLKTGQLGGAGLDVFEREPLPISSALVEMDHVVLGSHNANNMLSATEFVHDNTLVNLYKGLGI